MFKRTATALMLMTAFSASAQDCTYDTVRVTMNPDLFIQNADGTVSDVRNGLLWQKCSLGQTATEAGCSGIPTTFATWQEALQAAEQFNTDNNLEGAERWRLPNIKELSAIVEYACVAPSIDLTVFPDTPNGRFWTSTPKAGGLGARVIDFTDAQEVDRETLPERYIRLTRLLSE